jgi:ParB family transcriptional regulator, chromosome partitioning protein
MSLPLDHLDLLDEPIAPSAGAPLLLRIADIDEDPSQPRQEFDDEPLAELAATIRQRGVRQPVSVRPHPVDAGRWMLNFGARRLRASRLAGKDDIPAFVDQAADDYDQVIENEQREGLKPLELALFVKKRLGAGDSQQEIARRLGKSKAHITMVCALIDAPDWLLDAYRSGRCRGACELYELRRLHEARPDAVHELLARPEKVSREAVRSIKRANRPAREAATTACTPLEDAASLQQRADLLCVELESILDRLHESSAERLPALCNRIAAVAQRFSTLSV